MPTRDNRSVEERQCCLSEPDLTSGSVLDLLATARDSHGIQMKVFSFQGPASSTHSWDQGFVLYVQLHT